MKLSSEPKTDSSTDEGNYSEEQLEELLEHYVEAKKIEADPKLYAMVKDYAKSKSKQVAKIFDEAPKSLKDLKGLYDKKVREEDDEE